MHRLKAICLMTVLTAAGLLAPGRVHAQGSPFAGRWHWNKAQSTLPPGEPAPADLVMEIARADAAHVQWSITVKDQGGQSNVESFDAPANGESYPVGTDTAASFRLSGGALQATFTGPGLVQDTLSCTLSGNGSKMTCDGQFKQEDGKTARYVDVFDRS